MYKMFYFLFTSLAITLFLGCSTATPPSVNIEVSNHKVSFLKDVKPILDKRCVSCHSCYNSPCQAKLSSFEGLDRGASKESVYNALRFSAMKPTRLFIDASSTKEWRERGFYSISSNFDANATTQDSIMMHMLYEKKQNPKVIGSYKPEEDKLICPKDLEEMGEYLEDKPNHGMPYGFPALKMSEYNTLTQWLAQGSQAPTPKEQKELITPTKNAQKQIDAWEDFLNQKDAKHSVTARYLYEHLYLAHWHFKETKREFYELVRSKTPSPQKIEVIPTTRVFDNPKVDNFYYRLRKIHSTIVHKTHIVVEFDAKRLERIEELFIKKEWVEKPHYIDYDVKISANPFIRFFQIPAKSRYEFMLDNSLYFMMTFIKGPVCRGQMAVNVINDHIWIMFKDPEYDLSLSNQGFLLRQADNLAMPIETVSQNLLETFSDAYRNRDLKYKKAKAKLYFEQSLDGQGLESIWRGERAEDAPLLTIYRHFNSASVHKGVLGELPKTLWVIDYPLYERIYYSLVAGYDVFGNLSHQSNIRRYTDFLRFEAEQGFITYMPLDKRLKILKSWYINSKLIEKNSSFYRQKTKMKYKTEYPKSEFIDRVVNHHILKSTGIHFDDVNYYKEGENPPKMPQEFHTFKDIKDGFRALSQPGTKFLQFANSGGVNTMHLRIILPNKKSLVGTIVVNRWHNNVNSQFREASTLDASKDTLDFIPLSIGSYPNAFAVVEYEDLPDFFDLVANFKDTKRDKERFRNYFIGRSDKRFWETFDWFEKHFLEAEPITSGLYDLNRYYHK